MARTILLADDSITIQKVVELTLATSDYDVVSFNNGDDALAQLAAVSPDLVIADVHMPGASGYEIAASLKAANSPVPVLLLVGTFEPFDENQMEASGADGFLMKPFDSQELLSRVLELDTARHAAGEAASADEAPGRELAAQEVQPETPPLAPRPAAETRRVPEVDARSEPRHVAVSPWSDRDIDRLARRLTELISPEIVKRISRELTGTVGKARTRPEE